MGAGRHKDLFADFHGGVACLCICVCMHEPI